MASYRTANQQYAVEQAYALGADLAELWHFHDEHRFRVFNRVVGDVRSRVQATDGLEAARAFTLGVRRGLRALVVVA